MRLSYFCVLVFVLGSCLADESIKPTKDEDLQKEIPLLEVLKDKIRDASPVLETKSEDDEEIINPSKNDLKKIDPLESAGNVENVVVKRQAQLYNISFDNDSMESELVPIEIIPSDDDLSLEFARNQLNRPNQNKRKGNRQNGVNQQKRKKNGNRRRRPAKQPNNNRKKLQNGNRVNVRPNRNPNNKNRNPNNKKRNPNQIKKQNQKRRKQLTQQQKRKKQQQLQQQKKKNKNRNKQQQNRNKRNKFQYQNVNQSRNKNKNLNKRKNQNVNKRRNNKRKVLVRTFVEPVLPVLPNELNY